MHLCGTARHGVSVLQLLLTPRQTQRHPAPPFTDPLSSLSQPFGLTLLDYCALSFLSYFKMGTPYFDDFRKATLPPDWEPLHMAGGFTGKFQTLKTTQRLAQGGYAAPQANPNAS